MRLTKGWMRRGAMALLAAATALPVIAALSVGNPATAGASSSLPVGTFFTGIGTEITNPTGMPPGSDNWSCKPTEAHPYPVVLVHGTLANENFSWQALSPELANAGYCVYAFNYGATGSTLTHFFGLAPVATSAAQLSAFVNRVLASTGASQVDMVGHSQGGMMPRYYIQDLGGTAKTHLLVALAPSNDGTTVDGLTALVDALDRAGHQHPDTGPVLLVHPAARGLLVPGRPERRPQPRDLAVGQVRGHLHQVHRGGHPLHQQLLASSAQRAGDHPPEPVRHGLHGAPRDHLRPRRPPGRDERTRSGLRHVQAALLASPPRGRRLGRPGSSWVPPLRTPAFLPTSRHYAGRGGGSSQSIEEASAIWSTAPEA